jgi:hypothetical protein
MVNHLVDEGNGTTSANLRRHDLRGFGRTLASGDQILNEFRRKTLGGLFLVLIDGRRMEKILGSGDLCSVW